MISLAQGPYSKEEIIAQLHAKSGSRQVAIRYDLLNQYDIKLGELTPQDGGVISFNSFAEIKRTGKFVFLEREVIDVDWLNDRVRPVFRLRMPDGGWAEWPLGVFLLPSPSRREIGPLITRRIEAYDTSTILAEDRVDNRYRIAAGTRYVDAIVALINSTGIWKVNISDHPGTIAVDKEFEIGTSKLEIVNALLTEINYTSLWVDENGYFVAKPYVIPSEREVEYTYKDNQLSIIRSGAEEELDLFSVPNVWVVTASNPEKEPLVSRYVNNLPTSKTSTESRKRRIVDFRSVDDIYDQDTLDAYTKRIAYEASQVYGKVTFSTALMPHHSYMNILYLEHSKLGIADKFTETSWSMNLITGGEMVHNCRKVIHI